jgi:Spy/CpxP family protein refolding chaperone
MRYQQAIGLEPEQKTYLREEIRKAQLRFTELQWQLEDAMETLRTLLGASPVVEEQVLPQLEKVLDTERQIKRLQMGLMIRIKNKLTPEQKARLRELRSRPGED